MEVLDFIGAGVDDPVSLTVIGGKLMDDIGTCAPSIVVSSTCATWPSTLTAPSSTA